MTRDPITLLHDLVQLGPPHIHLYMTQAWRCHACGYEVPYHTEQHVHIADARDAMLVETNHRETCSWRLASEYLHDLTLIVQNNW